MADDSFAFETDLNAPWFDAYGAGAASKIATLQSTVANLTAADIWIF